MELLNKIQKELKAPKGQFNSFGKYKYRNCEDILEAVKPHLGDGTLTLSDEIVQLGDRFYVKATATLSKGGENPAQWEKVAVTAYAREALDKKGMDEAQITGAASSYARKYALNGLFCIDDTKDADSDEKAPEAVTTPTKAATDKVEPPKSLAGQREAYLKRIHQLLDEIENQPFMTDAEYEEAAKRLTGLDLTPEFFLQIGQKLAEISKPQHGEIN